MQRTYIKDLSSCKGSEVVIQGWVNVRRDQGKLIFFDFRDVTGVVQGVILPNAKEAHTVGSTLRPEWVVEVKGKINPRPEKNIQADKQNGDIELEILGITVLGAAKELPFDKDAELNMDTYLDHLPLTLRTERSRAIFKLQATIATLFREFFNTQGFTEIQAPKLIGDDAEGGANSFNIEYFGHTAHLAQSPQFYKQIMAGVFERVYALGNVYRAEKHSTTRHLNEYTSIDIEMGFIKDHTDVMAMENAWLAYVMPELAKRCPDVIKTLKMELPEVPANIPSMKLREAQQLIKKEYGEDCTNEPDLEPQHERWLCEYAKKTWNSDFIFVTHFPLSKRPMYTAEDQNDPGFAKGFDLLFRGVEITTGGQRVNDYDTLVAAIEKKGLNPEKFSFYLQAFKYGMPPHGGFGFGLERFTAKLAGLENVKEATLFPRDINRIDVQLSK